MAGWKIVVNKFANTSDISIEENTVYSTFLLVILLERLIEDCCQEILLLLKELNFLPLVLVELNCA